MGVMSCSRNGCDSIMCDTYVDGEIGYVCFDCQSEFKEYLRSINENPTTDEEVRVFLEQFMQSEKGSTQDLDESFVNYFFETYTRD